MPTKNFDERTLIINELCAKNYCKHSRRFFTKQRYFYSDFLMVIFIAFVLILTWILICLISRFFVTFDINLKQLSTMLYYGEFLRLLHLSKKKYSQKFPSPFQSHFKVQTHLGHKYFAMPVLLIFNTIATSCAEKTVLNNMNKNHKSSEAYPGLALSAAWSIVVKLLQFPAKLLWQNLPFYGFLCINWLKITKITRESEKK